MDAALAELMFRLAPEVCIVNATTGRRAEFLKASLETSWQKVAVAACLY
jgi:hypothetical protein